MKHFEFTVTDEYAGERIDKCISELYEDFSRSYIQKLIKDNLVNVSPNKENCELSKSVKGSYILKEGNFVFFDTKESIIPDIVPEDIPLDILYEDSDVLVVNKPKGMVVHPAPGHYSNTLVNAVMFHVKDLSGINGVLRPGIVHRIDMNTTGSLIICKNDKAHIDIAAQLKEHSINRLYRAIVHGVINEDEGTVNKPIGRNEKDRKKMACNVANSKNAITHYKVLKRFKDYTYIECKLETGRTHQIRVHMASIGHPVLGDDVYSTIKSPFKLLGQTLHAMTLGFIQPSTKEYIEVVAPLPEYFNNLLNILI
ncbi:MAG: RluA family pseudouridine synthase [Lachnospiraceae bacterium]|nr:RluA family pseudouridine synthase [Lachnospiraceae bacterium]MDY5216278.1 RluA family pseudouridine synthase [Lachnospiraceae bacterium]